MEDTSQPPAREARRGPPEVQSGTVLMTSPIGGVVRTNSREQQPEGTCWDAVNILPYDRSGRKRVAQRTGISKQFSTQLGSGAPVTGLEQVTIATLSTSSALFQELFPYSAGNLTAVTANWTLNSGGDASNFKTSGSNTLVITNPSNTSTTIVDSTNVGVGTSYTMSATINTTITTPGTDGRLIIQYGIGQPGTTTTNYVGPFFGFNTGITAGVSASFLFLGFHSSGVNNALVNYTLPAGTFGGVLSMKVTESGGTTSMTLTLNGNVVLSTSFAVVASAHKFFVNYTDGGITGHGTPSIVGTTSNLFVASGIGAGLPLDEKWAYSTGNLTAVQSLWVRQNPHRTPASMWVVPGGGTQVNWVPSTELGLGSFLPLIDYAGPLTGLGTVFTIASQVALQYTTPVSTGSGVFYRIRAGVPTGGILYEVILQFTSVGGVTITPLLVLNIYNKTVLVTSLQYTPLSITNTYSGQIQLIVNETTAGGTTLIVKDRGTTAITTQTLLTPQSMTIAFGANATPTTAGTLAQVSCTQGEFQISPGTTLPDVNAIRSSTLIATAGGYVYTGVVGQGSSSISQALGQPTPPLATAILPGIAGIFQKAYIVDGTHIIQLDVPSSTVEPYAATTGTAPTGCRFAINWRGRLMLAGDPLNPQNFYMSRAGTPTDWDYSQTDPLAAIVGNASTFGQIGQPITALIPFSDDTMVLGCTHSTWLFMGDPADGGTITQISDNMGVVANRAWCKDTSGNLYFIGTGGLYKLSGGGGELSNKPQLMSGSTFDAYFRNLNPASDYINMTWDSDTHYMHIFVTPSAGGQGTHLIWDERNGGFWPIQFPVVQGPLAVCQFFGDYSANTRSIMLGGWDGYIRFLDEIAIDDDGEAIPAYVVLGPIHPAPQAAILKAVTLDLGELLPVDETANPALWNVNATVRTGATAYDVTEGTPNQTYTVACPLDGRTKTFRQRLRGGWFSLLISNSMFDTYFTFEQAELIFDPSGFNRKQR